MRVEAIIAPLKNLIATRAAPIRTHPGRGAALKTIDVLLIRRCTEARLNRGTRHAPTEQ